ncbi:MAG: TIGR04219 family outer membrane beta-barrel protein, partial [Thermodesulfovibrionales bacterium]|nr:TIGR04219 family outer membrane beta-barrel protein [Thermodesulfovibrionales bacterium]
MRPFALIICLAVLIAIPASSYAIGIEVGLGAWQQDPQGNIAYRGADIDLEKDLKYDAEARVIGRVKIDMPLFIPNIYLMYTPMSFAGAGSKDASFTFGNQTFTANVPITSELTLDHYDIALFYGIPFLRTATAGVLNVDVGLNARIIDFKAKLDQNSLNFHESKSMTLPVPMVYVGAQIKPIKKVAIEAEA